MQYCKTLAHAYKLLAYTRDFSVQNFFVSLYYAALRRR